MPRFPTLSTLFNILQRLQTTTLATKNRLVGGRAVGATNRTLPRRNAVERSNLRPFGIKGYFGANRREDAANALDAGRREIVGKSRQSRRRSGRPAVEALDFRTVANGRGDADRRELRNRASNDGRNASRARVPPSPVPTRVSTIKYLVAKPGWRHGKFYRLFPSPPTSVNRSI